MLSACTVYWHYLQVAIQVFIKACIYSRHIHIFTGAPLQVLLVLQVRLCTLFCRHADTSSTRCYRNVQMSTGNCLAMQALAWLLMVQFRAILFGAVHFGTGYTNLRQSHIFKHQISGENLVLYLNKYGMMQIDSLTKSGKVFSAEELICITDMFYIEQSVFISNTFAMYLS